MKVFENKNGKIFYKNNNFLVKLNGIIGFIEFESYDEALKTLNGE